MDPVIFSLLDGTLEVNNESFRITDSAQKRKKSFLLLSIVGPLLAGLMSVSAYKDGNPLLVGIGIIVLAGFIALVIINRQQLGKIVDNFLFSDIKRVSFQSGRKKSVVITFYINPNKKREINLEETGSQEQELKKVLRNHGVAISET